MNLESKTNPQTIRTNIHRPSGLKVGLDMVLDALFTVLCYVAPNSNESEVIQPKKIAHLEESHLVRLSLTHE